VAQDSATVRPSETAVPQRGTTGSGATGIVLHEHYYWHDPGSAAGGRRPNGATLEVAGHAESPETKRRFHGLLAATGYLDHLTQIKPRHADLSEVLRFHTADYVNTVRAMSIAGFGDAGKEAFVGFGSYEIALLSVGGAIEAVDAVLAGRVRNAYALIRPPGHHAEADRGMGFCLFNNVALAAMHARSERNVSRIAIVDWDVHHGNGTQAAFYDNPDVLTISVHQDGRYPLQTGKLNERGEGAGVGANINIPLPPGSGHGAYIATLEQVIVPALDQFKPELVLVASGFDAGGYDTMANMICHSDTFRQMAMAVQAAADRHGGGRLVATHEGGYSPFHVPFCGLAALEGFTGIPSGVEDPYASLSRLPYQELQAHQAAVIDQAAAFVTEIPS
jgi:acetoin utilization deacetylase AcuC-like enzyme